MVAGRSGPNRADDMMLFFAEVERLFSNRIENMTLVICKRRDLNEL
jgi:hypothetical protein